MIETEKMIEMIETEKTVIIIIIIIIIYYATKAAQYSIVFNREGLTDRRKHDGGIYRASVLR